MNQRKMRGLTLKKKSFVVIVIGMIIISLSALSMIAYDVLLTRKSEKYISEYREMIGTFGLRRELDYSWASNDTYIAHAMGGIDGKSYTNSLEAFEKSYEEGLRVFETDIHLTDEGVPVLYHDKDSYASMVGKTGSPHIKYEEFKSTLLYNKYHTLDMQEIIGLLNQYRDIYIVIDWGAMSISETSYIYSGIVNYGKKYEDVLDRIIPEIVDEAMYEATMKCYPWKSYTLSYYVDRWDSVEEAIDFCNRLGIKIVDLPVDECTKDNIKPWIDAGIHVSAYTVNDVGVKNKLKSIGVDGYYTDSLNPKDVIYK